MSNLHFKINQQILGSKDVRIWRSFFMSFQHQLFAVCRIIVGFAAETLPNTSHLVADEKSWSPKSSPLFCEDTGCRSPGLSWSRTCDGTANPHRSICIYCNSFYSWILLYYSPIFLTRRAPKLWTEAPRLRRRKKWPKHKAPAEWGASPPAEPLFHLDFSWRLQAQRRTKVSWGDKRLFWLMCFFNPLGLDRNLCNLFRSQLSSKSISVSLKNYVILANHPKQGGKHTVTCLKHIQTTNN